MEQLGLILWTYKAYLYIYLMPIYFLRSVMVYSQLEMAGRTSELLGGAKCWGR